MKPLPQNIRVILTANEGASCPDSWRSVVYVYISPFYVNFRALPVSTLPSPTATDLQEVISQVTFGARGQTLSEDQVNTIINGTCILWLCVCIVGDFIDYFFIN